MGGLASAGPSAAPATALSAAPTPTPLRVTLESKLLAVAQTSFLHGLGAARTGGADLLSDQGGGLITDNGAGIISNNGSGLIANNGSGLVSDQGGGYRIAQAAPAISTAAEAGETLTSLQRFADGHSRYGYTSTPSAPGDSYRRIDVDAEGRSRLEIRAKVVEKHGSGTAKRWEFQELELHPDGALRFQAAYAVDLDAAGKVMQLAYGPGAKMRVPALSAAVDFATYELRPLERAGAFRYVYTDLGLTEAGTFSDVATNADGKLVIIEGDPLAYYDGDSSVTNATGQTIYTKRQRHDGATAQRTYDLGDGLVVELARAPGAQNYGGRVTLAGAEVASAVMASRPGGTVVFTITLPDAPDRPLVIGYGLKDAPASPPPVPRPAVATVFTIAGTRVAGHAEGNGAGARFSSPFGIVRSRVDGNRYYVADGSNHRIRVLTLGPGLACTVATYAGTGTAGHLDGPAASAKLNQPFGLAVGPDDTLFVSEGGNRRVRAIAPDGQVSTLAGDGVAAYADGEGALARFRTPAGLALEDGVALYVADPGDHRIRKIDLTRPTHDVSTFAGDGTGGFQEGAALLARFKRPIGLARTADGTLFVADQDNRRVRAIGTDRMVTTVFGTGLEADNFIDGIPPTQGGTNPLGGIAAGPDGQLFVSSIDVRFLAPDRQTMGTLAGGPEPDLFRDGPADEALFEFIYGVAPGPDGLVLVTDGHMVRAIAPRGWLDR